MSLQIGAVGEARDAFEVLPGRAGIRQPRARSLREGCAGIALVADRVEDRRAVKIVHNIVKPNKVIFYSHESIGL